MALGKKKAKADDGDATETDESAAAPAAKRSKGSIAVPIACLAVGALLGPKVLGTQGAAGATSAPAPPAEQAVELGEVVVLDPVTVNLADGRVLKVGVALQLEKHAEHVKADKDDPTKGYAPALDAVLDTLGRHSMTELVEPDGRDRAKETLVERLDELTHGEVVDVYFHQFVMG
jgi:flagellar protein FliL